MIDTTKRGQPCSECGLSRRAQKWVCLSSGFVCLASFVWLLTWADNGGSTRLEQGGVEAPAAQLLVYTYIYYTWYTYVVQTCLSQAKRRGFFAVVWSQRTRGRRKAKPSQAKPSQAKPSQEFFCFWAKGPGAGGKPSQAKPSQAKPSQAERSEAQEEEQEKSWHLFLCGVALPSPYASHLFLKISCWGKCAKTQHMFRSGTIAKCCKKTWKS